MRHERTRVYLVGLLAALVLAAGAAPGTGAQNSEESAMADSSKPAVQKSENEWKQELSQEEYKVLRQCGTEPPFTGKYWNTKTAGTYVCAACGNELFSSETKYESGSGWPSFWNVLEEGAVTTKTDRSHGMVRTEVLCENCGGHLGHVFGDGPPPTGKRYCINSVALKLEPEEEQSSGQEAEAGAPE